MFFETERLTDGDNMYSKFACLMTLVLLLGCFGNLAAQEDTYEVQNGDNLWNLAGQHLDDAKLWEKIYEDNPFLREPGRRFQKNGIVYVMIRSGEKLVGLEKLGIMATLTPIEKLGLVKPDPVVIRESLPIWAWWPLILVGLLALVLILAYRWLRRDPTRVGVGRVLEGGIHTPAAAADHFRQQIGRQTGTVPASLPIISLVRGRGYGQAGIEDRAGEVFQRILAGESVWEATVRLPGGSQAVRYSLWACANDVRGGRGWIPGTDFRFVADQNVTDQVPPAIVPAATPAPEPAAQPEPKPAAQTAPAPEPPPVITESGEFVRQQDAPKRAWEPGIVKIELRKATDGKGAMVKAVGVDEADDWTFESEPGVVVMRYRPKQ